MPKPQLPPLFQRRAIILRALAEEHEALEARTLDAVETMRRQVPRYRREAILHNAADIGSKGRFLRVVAGEIEASNA